MAIHDLRVVKNPLIIKSIKEKIANSKKKLPTISNRNVIFMLNLEDTNKVITSFTILSSDHLKFINKVVASIKIKSVVTFDKILEFMTSEHPEEKSNLDFEYEISDFKFLKPDNIMPYIPLSNMKIFYGLGNHIDLEKDGHVFYTVPSEDKLDDVHMVYESGNEKKEFKFTNLPEKPIVPVEETNKINQENIKPKKNFFSLPSFISKFFKKNYQEKNNNDFLNEEQKKLKVD